MEPRNAAASDVSEVTPILCSVQEAARLLDLSRWGVYTLLERGDLDGGYVGGRRKVVVASIHRYIADLPQKRGESA